MQDDVHMFIRHSKGQGGMRFRIQSRSDLFESVGQPDIGVTIIHILGDIL